jgi:hypothetical protein
MPASFATVPDNGARKLVQGVALHQQQRGTCTNTTKYFVPTYDEVVNLTVCCKQRIKRIEW